MSPRRYADAPYGHGGLIATGDDVEQLFAARLQFLRRSFSGFHVVPQSLTFFLQALSFLQRVFGIAPVSLRLSAFLARAG